MFWELRGACCIPTVLMRSATIDILLLEQHSMTAQDLVGKGLTNSFDKYFFCAAVMPDVDFTGECMEQWNSSCVVIVCSVQ